MEIELRFDVGPADLTRLAKKPGLDGLVLGRPATRLLSSTYYDTPALGFAKAGLALRVRKTGRHYVQTVKTEARDPLAAERGEFENELPSADPDLRCVADSDVREKLRTIADEAAMEPILETEIRRTTRVITTPEGGEIELAIDRGEIRTLMNGRKIVPVSEVELELKRGDPHALYEVARLLAHAAPLVVNIESKAQRGLRALEGEARIARKAGRIDLPRHATSDDVFRASMSHCLRHIAYNTSALAGHVEPDAVHQLRVGLRRLRVALSALGDSFRVPEIEALRAQAKTFADTLAPARNLDVFAQNLLDEGDCAAKTPDLWPLRHRLDDLRKDARRQVTALVRSPDFTAFLLDIALVIDTCPWREGTEFQQLEEASRSAKSAARHVLDKALKKARKRAKHLAELDFKARHRLRIALKKLRYTAEFFSPLFDAKAVAGFLSALSRLQDLFGAMNDAATAEDILDRAAQHAGDANRQGLDVASAFVLGWHESRIPLTWEKAKKRWKRFIRTEPFWAG